MVHEIVSRRHTALFMLVTLGLLGGTVVAGCGGDDGANGDACAALPGTSFVSEEDEVVGMGASGPVKGKLYVVFHEDGTLSYQTGDAVSTVAYTCASGAIKVTDNQLTIEGTFDADAGILVWRDKRYLKGAPPRWLE